MQDLCTGSVTLDPFKAVVFVGGFSYADVLGSAKGKCTRMHSNVNHCEVHIIFFLRNNITFS